MTHYYSIPQWQETKELLYYYWLITRAMVVPTLWTTVPILLMSYGVYRWYQKKTATHRPDVMTTAAEQESTSAWRQQLDSSMTKIHNLLTDIQNDFPNVSVQTLVNRFTSIQNNLKMATSPTHLWDLMLDAIHAVVGELKGVASLLHGRQAEMEKENIKLKQEIEVLKKALHKEE